MSTPNDEWMDMRDFLALHDQSELESLVNPQEADLLLEHGLSVVTIDDLLDEASKL